MALSRLTIDLAVGLAGFESDLGRAANITQREMRRMENEVSRMAKRTGALLGAGLVTGFTVATKAAADFEKSMAEVSTLLDDTSSLDSMTDSVKSLSKEFGKAPTEQAEALYQIISSGAEAGSEAIGILTASNKLAVGGITDLRTAADGLTNVLNAYGSEAGTVSQISDKFFAAMKAGKTTVGELAGSIGPVISTAKELGVGFDELVAAGATLTTTGVRTQQAFNNLRAAFANIIKPSKEATDLAAELGIEFRASALESQTFAQFLGEVQRATDGNIEKMAQLFGSVEGLNAVLALTGSSSETFRDTLDGIRDSAGETEKAVDKVAETVSFAFGRLKSALSVELIETGDIEGLSDAIKFLADNVDLLINFLKALATILGSVLASSFLTTITNLNGMTKAIGVARIAFASMLGVVGLVAASIASVVTAYQRIQEIMADASRDIVQTTELYYGQAEALRAVSDAAGLAALRLDLQAKISKTASTVADLEDQLARANAEFERLTRDGGPAAVILLQQQSEKIEELEMALRNANRVLAATRAEMELAAPVVGDLAGGIADFVSDVLEVPDASKAAERALKELEKAVQGLEKQARAHREELREMIALEDKIRALADALDPVGAQLRRFGEMAQFASKNAREFEKYGLDINEVLALIDMQARETIVSMLGLGNQFKDTSKSIATDAERMREAVLEGVRQMTESFGNMWTDILRGAENSFDSIRDSFAQLLGNLIRSATTDKIQLQFEQAFGEGGGGFKDLNLKELGKSFGAIAAAEFSDDVIQGLFGDSSTEKYVEIGKQIGTAVGAIIGTIIPGIGTALGAALGAIAGSIKGLVFGKLFGRDPLLTIGGSGFAQRDGQAQISTDLGDVTSFRARGNVGGFSDTDLPGFEIGKAIEEFDSAIYQVLQAIGGEDQLQVIRNALMNWGGTWEDGAITIENILGSRFDTILETFSADIQEFVDRAGDFEEQVNRFGIALSAEKFFNEAPELFGGKSLSEFFAIVEDINGELGNLGQTFQEVAEQLLQIGGLVKFLEDFSASDVEAEFNALLEAQNRTVGEALANVNQQLLTAADNFDGSVESLEEIAGLVATVREGEIRYLSQLNSLQEGLNANLDKLEAEVKGVTAAPVSVDELLSQLNAIAVQAQSAGSAEELAFLEQQFLSVARSISPEDTIANQATILALIGSFREAANTRIEEFRSAAIENAENVRAKIDELMTRIGSPLDILVASNERIAQGVEALAGTDSTTQLTAEPVDTSVPEPQIETLLTRSFDANGQYSAEINNTMRDGLDQIAIAIRDGQDENAQAIVEAIRNGRFQVIVLPQNEGFVQQ